MKIQINSLAVLERLIGGDSELEVDIRNSCIQEFAKRHLKHLAESALYAVNVNAVEAMKQQYRKEIESYVDTRLYSSPSVRPDIERAIRNKAQERVDSAIKETIDTALADIERKMEVKFYIITENVIRAIDKRATAVEVMVADAEFEKRVQLEVRRRLAATATTVQ